MGVDAFKAIQDSMSFALAVAALELAFVHGRVVAVVAAIVAATTSSTVSIVGTSRRRIVGFLDFHVVADDVDHLLVELPSHGGEFRRRNEVDGLYSAGIVTHGAVLIP